MTAAERARRVLAGWIREAVHATMSGSREAVATYADLEEMIADAIAAAERDAVAAERERCAGIAETVRVFVRFQGNHAATDAVAQAAREMAEQIAARIREGALR